MGTGILRAVDEVFPGILDFICHFHFLKAQGKNLFEQDYNTIRRHLRSYKLSTQLRKMAKALKQTIDDDEVMMVKLSAYLQRQKGKDKQNNEIDPTIKAYLLITWVLEASSASHGFGFPFDRVHFDTYKRLKQAYPALKDIKPFMKKGILPLTLLHKIVVDSALESVSLRITEKIQIGRAHV